VKTPTMTNEMASVRRIRYSTESFKAGRATMEPTMKASTMPTSAVGTKFQPWTLTR
jgi:hypothetical protein